jgi:hypothetical protein
LHPIEHRNEDSQVSHAAHQPRPRNSKIPRGTSTGRTGEELPQQGL